MKSIMKIGLLAAGMLLAFTVVAQDIRIGDLTPDTVDAYRPAPSQAVLRMTFGKSAFLDMVAIRQLKGKTIKTVTLLYSDYPRGRNFDVLNQQRLDRLRQVFPEVFAAKPINWIACRQTGCDTRQQAEELLHGFVFTLDENVAAPGEVVAESPVEQPVTQETPAVQSVEAVDVYALLPVQDHDYVDIGKDTTSTRVMERNHWKDMVLVCDWTASMYEYTTQLLRWHVENNSRSQIRRFVFFNDGDSKMQREKLMGNAGGIYTITSDSLRRVVELMKHVKKKGSGGDLPENNIEALLFTIGRFPEAHDIVMIADAGTSVRDISLLPKVTRPVHVIVCKVARLMLLDYIRIARSTGGSLHTKDVDYTKPEELEKLEKEVMEEIEKHRREMEEKRRHEEAMKKKGKKPFFEKGNSRKKIKKELGK